MSNLINLPISQIQLDQDNPRIKHFLDIYGGNITAEAIALALSNSSNSDATTSFVGLRDSIKASKGIIHPIVVSHEEDGRYIVIEGNTRLQIYKEFDNYEPNSIWASIPAIVYEDLDDYEKHKIRLQSHLVGPREWDPYSKAKYLWELSEVEHLPLTQIVFLCGGRKSEIQKLIDAYVYMETKYRPIICGKGLEFNVRDFSKFVEYQNSNIKRSILQAGYEEDTFAEWVADDLIDVALKVRRIPDILKSPDARTKFLHSNLTEAEKVLNASELEHADLSKYPYHVLAQELYKKMVMGEPTIPEIQELINNKTDDNNRKIYYLQGLKNQISLILDTIMENQ